MFRDVVSRAAGRGWFSYFVTPSDDTDGLTRVERLKPNIGGGRRVTENLLPGPVLERWSNMGAYPVDAVLTNNPIQGILLRRFFQGVHPRKHAVPLVPVLVWNVSHAFFDSDEVQTLDAEDLAMWAAGYCVNENIMCTPWALERCRDVAAAFCGAGLVSRFDRNWVGYMGPDCDAVDRLRAPRKEKFSMYFGGRLTGTKGGEASVEQYLRFVMAGNDCDVYVTYVGSARRLDKVIRNLGGRAEVHAAHNLPWVDAISLMTSCHTSIFYQSLRMFPAACFEQLYAGLVVLIRDTGTERDLLPPGYPYLFKTDAECAAMLRWVHENFDEASARISEVPSWVRARYNRPLGIDAVLDRLGALAEERSVEHTRGGDVGDLQATLTKAIEAVGVPCGYAELGLALRRLKPNLLATKPTQTRKYRLMDVVANHLPVEFADDCEEPAPRYVRAVAQ